MRTDYASEWRLGVKYHQQIWVAKRLGPWKEDLHSDGYSSQFQGRAHSSHPLAGRLLFEPPWCQALQHHNVDGNWHKLSNLNFGKSRRSPLRSCVAIRHFLSRLPKLRCYMMCSGRRSLTVQADFDLSELNAAWCLFLAFATVYHRP